MTTPHTITPSINQSLALRLGNFSSLVQALEYAAQGQTGLNFYHSTGTRSHSLSYSALHHLALKTAAYFQMQGLKAQDRVALIAETRCEFLIAFFACQYAGLIACPLPYSIYLGGKDAYITKLNQMLTVAQTTAIIFPKEIETCILEIPSIQSHTYKQFYYEDLNPESPKNEFEYTPQANAFEHTQLQENDSAYLQFSSGSTASPKGILVSQKAVMANINAILNDGMQLKASDRAFSWLPFYHDMGLVGFILAPLCGQRSVDYLAPSHFVRRPSLWLHLMSENQTSITYAPSFGYKLALQRINTDSHIDLSALRIAGIGGDMIHAQTLQDFSRHFATFGFKFSAFLPSYGMAEATLAISMTHPEQAPVIQTLDMENNHCKTVVSCGSVLPCCLIKIIKTSDSKVGEIWIKGPNVITTQMRLDQEGFMATGDLGYLDQNLLFITGRQKDLIIIRGRNIWAQDVEWLLEQQCQTLKTGNIGVISDHLNDEESLIIIIQCKPQSALLQQQLIQIIKRIINQSLGIEAQVLLVPFGSLPFTSSGKLSRTELKARYQKKCLKILTIED